MKKPILYGCIVCPYTNKVRFALEMLKIDYKYQEIDILTGKNKNNSYLQINPQGRVPSLTTINNKNLYDSQVLLQYIEDEYKGLFPQDNYAKGLQRIWVQYFDNNIFSKYHPALAAYQENKQDLLNKLQQETFENMKFFSQNSGITQKIKLKQNCFYEGGSIPTYADVAIIPHLRIMNIFWKHFLNKDLFQSNKNDEDVLSLKQLYENIHTLESCQNVSFQFKQIPTKGDNQLVDDLINKNSFNFENYIVNFLKIKLSQK
ncbi:glutathione S-transferase, amine-terminal domain protein (macronuclear) [Tetrahymena thermophila SB210]|uniref:Glutathione S-transferase, amine-terminal domain protein n=1 Tax=Tetrahymena thermophila (strain SB210) TaxID=312017 RepID=Q22MM4_TETTS|nr:glutathione S-transferase, amine-terminal domain protein [Tetrahymena thermophila SB210]EAR86567.1 glutathione S-transferase, amine-terminal domain protein [Tetrahymena thermophila SB210]|eukprot:XP_976996.1 glutathione S-transferase, amine-terminal domain protein [Tetrahymena thermophila SB210]